MEALSRFLPGWAIALIAMVLSSVLIGLTTWEATGSTVATIIAVIAGILGPGIVGAKAITGSSKPPSDPPPVAP
jgi:hypothetical protein